MSQLPIDPVLRRAALHADCSACTGLCCVGPTFAVSSEFAIDKPAGTPCPNLRADFRCGIHDGLRELGFSGCVVFDCFGAGQRLAACEFSGRNWRDDRELAPAMFVHLMLLRQVHELLRYLDEALAMPMAEASRRELGELFAEIDKAADATAAQLAGLDIAGYRSRVGELLGRVSRRVRPAMLRRLSGRPRHGDTERRAGGAGPRADLRLGEFGRADLAGASLRAADLRAANLRGALLLGADLRDADLRAADLLGADLRGADLRGARLTEALFVTGSQLESALGDQETQISPWLGRPRHWWPVRGS